MGGVKTGMIKLGERIAGIYPNIGFMYENSGGTIVFNGNAIMGNGCSLTIGKNGMLNVGDKFAATSEVKILCYDQIDLGKNVLCGWRTIIMDTDFHKMKYIDGHCSTGHGKIEIGDNCWIAYNCTIMKGTILPSYTIVASNSQVSSRYSIKERSMIAGIPAKLVKEGIYLDREDDIIEME